MFENITAEVLNRLLGSYVSPSSFQADRVSTSVYKGHVLLSRLELREDALDRLLLPVSLKKGLIMKAEISIPWTQLGSKPVEIVLDGVYLLANPKVDWTEDELDRRAQASKMAKLVQAELMKRSREAMMGLGKLVDGTSPDASFTSRLMARVTDNVEMRLKNVHIRFEDGTSFSFGVTLESFSAQTTDANWIPRFKENPEGQTHKLCKMERFSVYADPPSTASSTFSLFNGGEEAFIKFFSETMPHANDMQSHAYIVRPMDASLRVTMHRETALTKFEFFCRSLDVRLETFQIMDFMAIANMLSKATSSISSTVSGLKRPTASPMQDPRGWWQYVGSYALKMVKEKRYKWSRAYFVKRRRDRLEYTLLWKRQLVGGLMEDNTRKYAPLSSQDKVRIEWLEKCLEFNDIMLFRSYAENELRLEKAHQELWEMGVARTGSSSGMPTPSSSAAAASGWIAWALGMSSSSSSSGLKESLSQQDVERFLTLLKHNPAVTVLEKEEASETAVSAVWSFEVPKGSLFFNPIRASFGDLNLELTSRLDHSTAISLSLDSLAIYDGFKRILGRRGEFFSKRHHQRSASMDNFDIAAASNSFILRTIESLDLAATSGGSPKKVKNKKDNALIVLKVDTNPSQADIDQAYQIRVGALEYIHSAPFTGKLAELAAAFPASTSNSMVHSTSSPTERNAVAIALDIRTPLLVFPSDRIGTASTLVVDLGRFSIQDQSLRTKAQVTLALESKNLQDDRLFDTYTVHISRVFVWLANSGKGERKLGLVDRFGMRAVCGKRVQSLPDVPRYRISLECNEVINVRLSPSKLAGLAVILRSLSFDSQHSKAPVKVVEVVRSLEKCSFVHPIPSLRQQPEGAGANATEDDESLIFNGSILEEGREADGNVTSTDFDASSEFFSVADDNDERESFMSRSQRFFDALNGDDSQSEIRTKFSTKKKATIASSHRGDEGIGLPHTVKGGGGTVMSLEDDSHSFFTADSSVRRNRQQQRMLRRVSSMVSKRVDERLLQVQAKWIGFAVHYSTTVIPLVPLSRSATGTVIGSPVSNTTLFRRQLPVSIRRNGSSQVSAVMVGTPMMNTRELPVHVRSWLDELRRLEGDDSTSGGIAPLPTASPPPMPSHQKPRRHPSIGGVAGFGGSSSTATSTVDSEDEGDDDVGSLGTGIEETGLSLEFFQRKERTALIFRVDKIGFGFETISAGRQTFQLSLGHVIAEEVIGGEGEEEIFSRFLLHSGLRIDEHDRLSYFGEDEESILSCRLDTNDKSEIPSELTVTMNRPVDLILNYQVLRDTVLPIMTETLAAIPSPADPSSIDLKPPSVSPPLPFAKTSLIVAEVRSWLVDESHLPFAMLKASRMDFTIENAYDGSSKAQGRIFNLEGRFFPIKSGDESGAKELSFLSRRPDMDDDSVPLIAIVGIRHPLDVERHEVPPPSSSVVVTPESPLVNDQETSGEIEEEMADQVIDSILGTSLHHHTGKGINNGAPPSPFLSGLLAQSSQPVYESYKVMPQGDELFVNVLPIRMAVFGSMMTKFVHMLSLAMLPTSSDSLSTRAATTSTTSLVHPTSIRMLLSNPMLELMDEVDRNKTITIGCSRLESCNRLFQRATANSSERPLLERIDLFTTNSYVDVNAQRITRDGVELKMRATDSKVKISLSEADVKVTQEQIGTCLQHMVMLGEVAKAFPSSSAKRTSKQSSSSSSLLLFESDLITISLLNGVQKPTQGERRGLIVRPNRLSSSSLANSRATQSSSAFHGSNSSMGITVPCIAVLKLNKAAARVEDDSMLRLSLESFVLQQGVATVRKNHFVQLITLPSASSVEINLDPSTASVQTISVRVPGPRFVYVPETIRDLLFFTQSIPALPSKPPPPIPSSSLPPTPVPNVPEASPSFFGAHARTPLRTINDDRALESPSIPNLTPLRKQSSGHLGPFNENVQVETEPKNSAVQLLPFVRCEIQVNDSEFWLGGGTFSKALLVAGISKVQFEVESEPVLTAKVSLLGCSCSIRKDTLLPMISTIAQHHLPPLSSATLGGATASSVALMISSIEEEGAKRICLLPFNISLQCGIGSVLDLDFSPVRLFASSDDLMAIGTTLSDLSSSLQDNASLKPFKSSSSLSGTTSSSSVSAAAEEKKFRPLVFKVQMRSLEAVYLNKHNFPIVKLVVESLMFSPAPFGTTDERGLLGTGEMTMSASHHFKRDWEVLMEECTLKVKMESLHRLKVFCESPININLMQSLLDGRDSRQEESEKIRHFVNQTGLSVKRVVDKFHVPSAETEDFFCSVGDSLEFRLTNKSSPGRFWQLKDVACPKRGKVGKGVAVSDNQLAMGMMELESIPGSSSTAASSIVVVYESDASTSSFVIKSPLRVKNETIQPLELAVAFPGVTGLPSQLPSSSSLHDMNGGSEHSSDLPSRSTTPDSVDTFALPTPSGTPNPLQQQQGGVVSSTGKRRLRRSHHVLANNKGNYHWLITLAPNESVSVPADTAQLILSGRFPLLARPHAQVSGAPDYAFAELKLSSSAQTNHRLLKKSIAFSDFGSFSSMSSNPKDQMWTSHYVVETKWTDPYSQCLIFSSPVILTNYLHCATTYRLGGGESAGPKVEGQLPSGAELKWHGQAPTQSHLMRLSLKIPGFEWSDPVPAAIGLYSAAAMLNLASMKTSTSPPTSSSSLFGLEESGSRGGGRLIPTTTTPMTIEEQQKIVGIDLKDGAGRVLKVDASVTLRSSGRVEITLSVPFWIVNNTDLPVLFASSVMETLGSRVSAGQLKTIATMRRIRLMNQLEEEYRDRQYRRRARSHSRMLANRRILSATHAAPTGLLELLDSMVGGGNGTNESLGGNAMMPDGDVDNGGPMMMPGGGGNEGEGGGGGLFDSSDIATTMMFSSHHFRIRFWDSRWSDTCFFDHANEQVIQCKQEWRVRDPAVARAMYVVSVKVEDSKLCPNLTKVVTLSPRFVLVNALDRTIKVRQWRGNLGEMAKSRSALSSNPVFSGGRAARYHKDRFASSRGSGILSLNPGERVPFHWRDKSGPRQVSACFDEFGWEWSSGIAIEDCVGEFCSRLRNRHTQQVYILRVDVQLVDATVVVTFRPELPRLPPYRVDNLSLQTIRFRQVGAPLSSAETLLPYHSCAYTWDLLDLNARKAVIVETLARTDELGEEGRSLSSMLFMSSSSSSGGGMSVFRPSQWWWFLWSRPPASRALGTFSLDKHFGYLNSSLDHVGVALHADGPTRVLTISDARMPAIGDFPSSSSTSRNPPFEGSSTSLHDQQQQQQELQNDGTRSNSSSTSIEIALSGLGISLIEESNLCNAASSPTTPASSMTSKSLNAMKQEFPTSRRELLRIFLANTQLKAGMTEEGDPVVEFNLGDLQIDNQLLKATYPVLLCSNRRDVFLGTDGAGHEMDDGASSTISPSTAITTTTPNKSSDSRFLTARLIRSNRVPTLDVLKLFKLRLAPIQLNLEAEIVHALMRIAASVHVSSSDSNSPKPLSSSSSLDQIAQPISRKRIHVASSPMNPSGGNVGGGGGPMAKKFYVEYLRIDPIEVRVNVKGALALIGGSQWFGAHLEGASLYLREFTIQHSLLSVSNPIAKRVFTHYMQSLKRHWYVLISSVDLLGDPIGFLKTLWGGIVDAGNEVKGSISWESGLKGFGKGVYRGVWMLFRAAVVGLTSSVVNVCNGASAALTSVSSSPHAEGQFRQPRGMLFGDIAQGLAGLVVLPTRGYQKEGGRGFVIGFVKGAIGVFARPMSGVLKLVTRIAESLRTAVDPTSKVNVIRRRTPRFLRSEQPLQTFNAQRAFGEEALWNVGLGSEVWVDHMICSKNQILVLTETRLVTVMTSQHHQEFSHATLSLQKVDFVVASVSTDSPLGTVILHCLPSSQEETADELGNGQFGGFGGHPTAGASKLGLMRVKQKRGLCFQEKTMRCESVEVAEAVVQLLNRWGRGPSGVLPRRSNSLSTTE